MVQYASDDRSERESRISRGYGKPQHFTAFFRRIRGDENRHVGRENHSGSDSLHQPKGDDGLDVPCHGAEQRAGGKNNLADYENRLFSEQIGEPSKGYRQYCRR